MSKFLAALASADAICLLVSRSTLRVLDIFLLLSCYMAKSAILLKTKTLFLIGLMDGLFSSRDSF